MSITATNGHRPGIRVAGGRAFADLTVSAAAPRAGRLTADSTHDSPYLPAIILQPPDAEGQWRALDLDLKSLDRIPASRILELLADLSPLLSRAAWDFQRFCNPGWSYDIVAEDGQTVVTAPKARAATDAFLTHLGARHGSKEVQFNNLFTNALFRGGFFGELVLDRSGRLPIDLAVPDAASVRFKRLNDPDYGTVYQLGQLQAGRFVALDRPTIRYAPIDPFPGSPYGRSPFAPMIFLALFDLGMKRDTRRVVAQQGWPRHDIVIDMAMVMERLAKLAEYDTDGDGFTLETFRTELARMLKEIQDGYATVPPDGAWVHTSDTTLNPPKGAVDTQSLGAIEGLTRINERASVQAGKSQGFLFSLDGSTTETQAIRQMEAFMQSIRAFQHPCEDLVSGWLTTALQAQGIPGRVAFRFAENRASEEIRDETVRNWKLRNARLAYDNGLIDMDEQAQYGWDKDTADATEPRAAMTAGGNADQQKGEANQDGQAARGNRGTARGDRASTPFTPEGADEDLPAVPDAVDLGDDDLRGITGLWDKAVPKRYRGLLDAEVADE